jgi:hypothetical protein
MGQMEAAIAYLKNQDVPNYAAVSKLFDIKPMMLRRRFLGILTSRASANRRGHHGSAVLLKSSGRSRPLSHSELPWAALSSLGGHERPLQFADGAAAYTRLQHGPGPPGRAGPGLVFSPVRSLVRSGPLFL